MHPYTEVAWRAGAGRGGADKLRCNWVSSEWTQTFHQHSSCPREAATINKQHSNFNQNRETNSNRSTSRFSFKLVLISYLNRPFIPRWQALNSANWKGKIFKKKKLNESSHVCHDTLPTKYSRRVQLQFQKMICKQTEEWKIQFFSIGFQIENFSSFKRL